MDYDYLIIGAGPSGLQLAYYLQKYHCRYKVLEAGDCAAHFFKQYPRNRCLISFNKTYSIYNDPEIQLRWDWNSLLTDDYSFLFRDYSREFYPHADDLIKYLNDFYKHFKLNIQFKTKIVQVSRNDQGLFLVTDQQGKQYRSTYLIMATGLSQEYLPPINGIEQVCEFYSNVSLNADDFINQRVLIIGKGNSGFEIADNLLARAALIHLASPDTIQFAWQSRFAGHLRANFTKILDTYQLKLLNSALDCTIQQIEKKNGQYVVTVRYSHALDETEELVYDRVICCTGFKFDASIFGASCQPELVQSKRLPNMTSSWESTNIKNLFFSGVLTQVRDYQRAASTFIDGFRYNARTLVNVLESKCTKKSIVHKQFPLNVSLLLKTVMERISRSSALWAQFGYMADLIFIDIKNNNFLYYEELPIDYILENHKKTNHYYTITFEWGEWQGDIFAIERKPSHKTAYTNAFLHPIIRSFRKDKKHSEHHVLEDLFGTYNFPYETGMIQKRSNRDMKTYHHEEHEIPLLRFFERELKKHLQPQKKILTD